MSSPNAIQDAIKAHLQAHAWFTTPMAIGIYSEDEGDLAAKISAALGPLGTTSPATGGGLAILIGCPYGSNGSPLSVAVMLDSIIDINCVEMPTVCRSAGGLNKTSYQAGRILAAPLSSPTNGLHGWATSGVKLRVRELSKQSMDEESGLLIQTVSFSFIETIN